MKNKFNFVDAKNFPIDECTNKDTKEKNIYESDKKYLALIFDEDFGSVEYKIGSPYIYKNNDEVLYGWDFSGNPIGNYYLPVLDFGELVLAFKEIPDGILTLSSIVSEAVNVDVAGDTHKAEEILSNITNTIQNIFDDSFVISNTETFPESECIENYDDVLYGKERYLCLVMDIRVKNSFAMREMYPYKCLDDSQKDKYLYGWSPNKKDGDFTDNVISSVHGRCWDEYVIAFSRIENN